MFIARSFKTFNKFMFAQPVWKTVPIYRFSTTPNIEISADEVEGKIYELLRLVCIDINRFLNVIQIRYRRKQHLKS